ncbi:LCP family protein [Chamaesiphon minutus]|uniref:Cell envelope-related function transcriptional attenuator common domain protein n=1 Tax=Chamaesiphon minutus (strain ATCC 27169 / PCC 6605) TaxID=1173020 RepID=K9UPJ7_CHAP6|nr:LCP family protein [Chamaesiphon minutus]AFY96129.1 cell envelope-related function transcriptional attenuator common domain protein [Chamaesiphon minutus PCC 6605]
MSKVEVRKVDRQRRKSSKPSPQMVRRQPAKKRRKVPLWLWLGLGSIGACSAAAGAFLAVSLTSAPLQQRALSAADAAFFNQNKEAFSRSLLQVPEVSKPVNILLLGIKTNLSDVKTASGNEQKKIGYNAEVDSLDGLSDTIMLLRFDPQTKRTVFLGIPRDTKIERTGHGTEKINAVDRESGPAAAAKEVSKVLGGVAIDRYIRLNNKGVSKLIDELGGVTVTVPKDIKYQDDSQHFYINLKAGRQHLDGTKLLGLLRYRNDANGDIGRMQRQQMVVKALMEQTLNPMTIARIPQLFSVIQSHVDTNLTVEELLALGSFSMQNGKSKMQMLMMPGDYNGDGKHGTSYWLPDEKGIQNMMARYFDRGTLTLEQPKVETLRVKIQDTSHFPDATARLIKRLNKAGYQNVHLDAAPKIKEDLAISQFIAQKGNPEVAEGLSKILGIGETKVDSSGNLYSDVTIKLGRDWVEKEQAYKTVNQKDW